MIDGYEQDDKDNIKARQVNIDSLSAEDIYDALGCEALDEEWEDFKNNWKIKTES